MIRRAAAIALVLALAGCGGSSHAHSSSTPAAARSTTAPASPVTGTVATVAGSPISATTLDHWVHIVIVSDESSNHTGSVIPDPPSYTDCIAQAGRLLAAKDPTTAQLRADCAQIEKTGSTEALDFLIKSRWLLLAAKTARITPSRASVQATFQAQKRKGFSSPAEFSEFLASSGQTVSDILLRIEANQIEKQLAKRAGGDGKLARTLTRRYRSRTHCVAAVTIADCAP